VHQINVESRAELELLSEIAAQIGEPAPIAIRVNPDVGAGGHEKISTGKGDAKFGVGVAQAMQLYRFAVSDRFLDPKGFAIHIGSQIKDLEPLRAAFLVIRNLVRAVQANGLPIERIDLGGGLGVPYFDEPDPPTPSKYADVVRETLGEFDLALEFEPGRMIAANAGVLLSSVVRVQERPARKIVVLDAAMNDLIRPAIYDAYHEIKPLKQATGAEQAVDVVGPICETGDTFTRNRMLPPLEAGDLVAFMTAGAYGAVMASTYNARALVPEVLVSGDRFEVVRRRWDVAEQLKLEQLPKWLES
jgi:diaminopimelate decarboxylase